jgi:hypothetical protein
MTSRSSGTAQISECTNALISRHHARAAVLAARTSTGVPVMGGLGEQRHCQVALGVAAEVFHDAL